MYLLNYPMAHILIDGYNLIGTSHRDLEKARQDLVRRLTGYIRSKRHTVTVVFDGWKDGQLQETRTRTGDLTVIYSRFGERADQVIMRMLDHAAVRWIVVTSDREIADFAAKKDFVAVTSDEFADKLFSTDSDDAASDEANWSDGSGDPARHGKRLSRAEKKKRDVLKGL